MADEGELRAERSAAAMWATDAASQGLGMVLEDVGPGLARMSMMVEPRMLNGHGMCHGAFIFAIADSTFAFACNSRNQRAVAQTCTITFLAPAQLGSAWSPQRANWRWPGDPACTIFVWKPTAGWSRSSAASPASLAEAWHNDWA